VTALERRLYIALLGARPIIAATANVNPRALKVKDLVDGALAAYKAQSDRELPEEAEDEGAHATGN
jgi:hypothetical protein